MSADKSLATLAAEYVAAAMRLREAEAAASNAALDVYDAVQALQRKASESAVPPPDSDVVALLVPFGHHGGIKAVTLDFSDDSVRPKVSMVDVIGGLPKPEADKGKDLAHGLGLWVRHTPGPCPVPPDTLVEVELENGIRHQAAKASERWWAEGGDFTITRYRVVDKEEQTYPDPPATSPAPWNDWGGGKCPVHRNSIVTIALRGSRPGDPQNQDVAGTLDWTHSGSRLDIVAYRVDMLGDNDGCWQDHHGRGTPPSLRSGDLVDVNTQGGKVARCAPFDNAGNWLWLHNGDDIVRWRPAVSSSTASKSPAGDENG